MTDLPASLKDKTREEQQQYERYWGRHDHLALKRTADKDGKNWRYVYHDTAYTKYMELIDEWELKNPSLIVPHRKLRKQGYDHAEKLVNKLINKHNEGLLTRQPK